MESAYSGQPPVTKEGQAQQQIQPTEQDNKMPPNAGNGSNNDENNREEPNHEDATQPDDIFQSETLIYREDSGELVQTEENGKNSSPKNKAQTPLNGQDPAPNSLQIEDEIRDPTPGTSTGKIRRTPESKLDRLSKSRILENYSNNNNEGWDALLSETQVTEEINNANSMALLQSTMVEGHTCLEEIFGSTSKPPNDIYVELILGKNAAI
jgi:hypothetical protein